MATAPNAVYFSPEDYAPLPRRLGAAVVDLVGWWVMTGLCIQAVVFVTAGPGLWQEPDPQARAVKIEQVKQKLRIPLMTLPLVTAAAYHIGLRKLRGGTLGYRFMRIRLVDSDGLTPRWRVLWRRFLAGVPLVLCFGLAYAGCRKSPRRQAMHDQVAGTWVVRRRAVPAGPAVTSYQTKLLGTYPLMLMDVEPFESPSAALADHSGATV